MVGIPNMANDLENYCFQQWVSTQVRLDLEKHIAKNNETRSRWSAFQPHKSLEAKLHLWDSVTAIAYQPNHDPEIYSSGSFSVLVKGLPDQVNVSSQWVEENFEKDVVQAVKDAALGTFLPVADGVDIFLDTRQIQKLRFTVLTEEGAPGRFEGITSDKRYSILSNDFVNDNFPVEFVKMVVKEGKKHHKKRFVHVPPGAPQTNLGHWMLGESYPILKYLQLGDATCLFLSLASALHYLHIEEPARSIAELAPQFSANEAKGVVNWKGLLMAMSEKCPWLVPTKIDCKSFDILQNLSEYPTVVSLEAVDGGTQHAITVVGRLVFDSNCERALPLSLETLHYCCSSDVKKGAYKKVYRGYRFMEPSDKKRKKLKELKCEFDIDFFMDNVTIHLL